MPKLSAGILLYRWTKNKPEVFLVHPGGPFWAKKDTGAWSIPKGEHTESEDSLLAAKREFKEETGRNCPEGEYLLLGEVKYGNKKVTAWFTENDFDKDIRSNFFEMEWPLKSGEKQRFPEVDRAGWFSLDVARRKLVKGQTPFVDMLAEQVTQNQTSLF
ncbi:MAG TPA: NUDIX domain-containing protein [Candidatus Saccharimonadales bacterium]|nr:NUDIX domain-containing protein [Candidatus Saccharimonadales bacterium]